MKYDQILITGVAGFIGSKVARRFCEEGHRVIGVDDLSNGTKKNIPSEVEFILGDISVPDIVQKIPRGCKIILHLAGQSSGEISFDNPVVDLQRNTISTLNLIHYGIENRSERIVYASSMSVYGSVIDEPVKENHPCEPISCYGVGKLASEHYLKIYQNKLPFVLLRMFNVYGPGQDLSNLRQGMVSIYLAQALNDQRIEVKGDLMRFRDLIYIDDVTEVWYRSSFSSSALNEELNLGTGIRSTVDKIIKQIKVEIPGTTHFISSPTPGDQSGIFSDNSKLKKIMGINKFISFEKGLNKFTKYLK
tara:strand:- start:507 stop:1421 length:915 start_codon:yes stop_codon:yes gene_type:complete